jgi:hypothetical protein
MKPDIYSRKNMIAEDLFSKDLIQVFNKKSGDWIATVKVGQDTNIEEPEEITEQKTENKNQLKLF